jgi:polysaccharide export outer membrane protein
VLLIASPAAAQPQTAGATDPPGGYIIGPRDVLTVTVWNDQTLSGDYAVDPDGICTLPLIGPQKVSGMTSNQAAGLLQKKFADGYFNEPRVSVAVKEYRSQRIFVIGQVRTPGTYPLTGEMTLIEALALAGSTTPDAASDVIITRLPAGTAAPSGPVLPTDASAAAARVFHVDIAALQTGELPNTVTLQAGDTIFVPQAERVYVFGHVASPGAYTISRGTTVRQVLSLAGGVTDRGAVNRTKIVRVANGVEKSIDAEMTDVVEPGDTVVVPARFF